MTTIESIVDQLNEGLISPVEALMWLPRFTTVAQHDPVFHVMLQIILTLNQQERQELDNVYSTRQD